MYSRYIIYHTPLSVIVVKPTISAILICCRITSPTTNPTVFLTWSHETTIHPLACQHKYHPVSTATCGARCSLCQLYQPALLLCRSSQLWYDSTTSNSTGTWIARQYGKSILVNHHLYEYGEHAAILQSTCSKLPTNSCQPHYSTMCNWPASNIKNIEDRCAAILLLVSWNDILREVPAVACSKNIRNGHQN